MSSSYRTSSMSNPKVQLGGGVYRPRSSSSKNPPEPLRRAVADCLSSASAAPSLHGIPSGVASGALRTLRDYLALNAATDLAYSVILEHTLAEKERSPAVVARCVAILKRYLLRYKPSEDILQQIDRFCMNVIAECDVGPSRRLTSQSHSSSQQSVASTSINSLPVSSYASSALVKSLNYVRSLVAQHLPKRSFQSAAFTGAPSTSRQSLPSLSSLLSKSFNSQLTPGNNKDSENKDASALAVSSSPIAEEVEGIDDNEFVALDVLKWRWVGDEQSSLLRTESDHVPNPQDPSAHNFLEVGAAALLVGDMEAKMKGQPWKFFGTADMPYLDQLLQPSLLTTVTSSASARAHLRTITASKRTKPGPNQIWEESPTNTFRTRARPLFQYRHYSDQQPLKLNPAEVYEVIAEVCSETPPNSKVGLEAPHSNMMSTSSKLSNNHGRPSMDVAVSVLIKLVIDMYVMDPGTAAPLTLYMLQEMLSSHRLASRSRAFDLILNLGVHGHLLEPLNLDDPSTIEENFSPEANLDNNAQFMTAGKNKSGYSEATNNFETWILGMLYEILLHLVQIQEKEESIWASALSCLLYFICDRGKIRRNRLTGLDIRVVKVLIEVSRRSSWAELVRSKLICMLTNMFYEASDISGSPKFLVQQVDLIGGIEFIFLELVLSNSREERRNLYVVLFDYVLHLINETCIANGSEYSEDEIQTIATLLMVADAPEAFFISVKLGVEGIGQLLKRSIADALATYPNSERLNLLLEKITEKLDAFISSFTHLDKEFTQMIQLTKSYNCMKSLADRTLRPSASKILKHSWATLHSLLHSERLICRQNGYVWLGDLLITEISDERDASMWSNIRNLQQKIVLAGVNDYISDLDVPLPIWLMCGLLKSRNTIIRWGFLFVLERLLMRCKFLLDENEMQHPGSSDAAGHTQDGSRLEKANAVIDIMSGALSLVAQINETDRINILKMCDILFSQLCLKVLPASAMQFRDPVGESKVFSPTAESKNDEIGQSYPQQDNLSWEDPMDDPKSRYGHKDDSPICETASMAALLLHGQAIVPMRLVARVPAALFYWPLIQLAGEATDNIALGVSVGSKGRGHLPGATSDIRATLLLLLIGKCTADPAAFQEVGGEEFFRELLDDNDSRVAYYSSTFLLKRMMTEEPERYQRMLQSLVFKAQQSNNEKLLENPYLQMRGILQLSNE